MYATRAIHALLEAVPNIWRKLVIGAKSFHVIASEAKQSSFVP